MSKANEYAKMGNMAISRQVLPSLVTARVSEYMAGLGALRPETRYVSRNVLIDNKGDVDSGIVKTICSFLTPSGLIREIDVPVAVFKGQIVEPSIGYVEGRVAILNKNLIGSISERGSIFEKIQPSTMYSTAYLGKPEEFRAMCESMPSLPRIFRSMF